MPAYLWSDRALNELSARLSRPPGDPRETDTLRGGLPEAENRTVTRFSKIRFTIDSITGSSPTGYATVTITARPVGQRKVPEETATGKVNVYDPCSCFIWDEPAADLTNRCGTAWYADPDGATAPRWEFDSLCCPAC